MLPLVSTWLALVLGAERVIAGEMTVMMMKRIGGFSYDEGAQDKADGITWMTLCRLKISFKPPPLPFLPHLIRSSASLRPCPPAPRPVVPHAPEGPALAGRDRAPPHPLLPAQHPGGYVSYAYACMAHRCTRTEGASQPVYLAPSYLCVRPILYMGACMRTVPLTCVPCHVAAGGPAVRPAGGPVLRLPPGAAAELRRADGVGRRATGKEAAVVVVYGGGGGTCDGCLLLHMGFPHSPLTANPSMPCQCPLTPDPLLPVMQAVSAFLAISGRVVLVRYLRHGRKLSDLTRSLLTR